MKKTNGVNIKKESVKKPHTALSALVGLVPPPRLIKNWRELRKQIAKVTNENYYQDSEPHITVYVNSFSELSAIETRLINILDKHKPFLASVMGVHAFGHDPGTNLYTLVYKIKRANELKKLQFALFNTLNIIRTDDKVKRYLAANPPPSKEYQNNIKKWGYFFGPDNWTFHSTICSVPKRHFDEIVSLAKNFNVQESWKVESIALFLKRKNDNHHKFYRTYKLGGK